MNLINNVGNRHIWNVELLLKRCVSEFVICVRVVTCCAKLNANGKKKNQKCDKSNQILKWCKIRLVWPLWMSFYFFVEFFFRLVSSYFFRFFAYAVATTLYFQRFSIKIAFFPFFFVRTLLRFSFSWIRCGFYFTTI